ncbi:MAG: polysaccharide deacetylase family protein [Dehalococcoidia bacterium]|nr:polysaccharide deacetylase family protein [Dehalococcoidia bacterium]
MVNDLHKTNGRVLLCLTCDVEDSSVESLGLIKETSNRHKAPITWFVEPRLCREPAALDLLREYCRQGDEVGLHVHWKDSLDVGLRNVSTEQIRTELEESMHLLKPYHEPASFRGGGLCQSTAALQAIAERGFRFDSSVASALDEPEGWHQGHQRIPPLSAYYPSPRGYDVVSHDGDERLDILEIPVTRGMPAPTLWCNMLEPDITPLSIMKLVFQQYHIRRHFQPLVIMVMILHSWSPERRGTMIRNLDRFLEYARSRKVDFETVANAGNQWKAVWEHQPGIREALLRQGFSSGLRTQVPAAFIKLAVFAYSWRQDPKYYPKRIISVCRNRGKVGRSP